MKMRRPLGFFTVFMSMVSCLDDVCKPPLELVLVQDTTESMQSLVDMAREELPKVVYAVKAVLPSARIGIVNLEDKPTEGCPSDRCAHVLLPLTDDVELVADKLGQVWADGGGDVAENQLGAIMRTILSPKTGWDWSNKDAQRIILLVTDNPSHITDIENLQYGPAKIVSKLTEFPTNVLDDDINEGCTDWQYPSFENFTNVLLASKVKVIALVGDGSGDQIAEVWDYYHYLDEMNNQDHDEWWTNKGVRFTYEYAAEKFGWPMQVLGYQDEGFSYSGALLKAIQATLPDDCQEGTEFPPVIIPTGVPPPESTTTTTTTTTPVDSVPPNLCLARCNISFICGGEPSDNTCIPPLKPRNLDIIKMQVYQLLMDYYNVEGPNPYMKVAASMNYKASISKHPRPPQATLQKCHHCDPSVDTVNFVRKVETED